MTDHDEHSSFIKTPRPLEFARAIVTMANQSGANLKEPAAPGK